MFRAMMAFCREVIIRPCNASVHSAVSCMRFPTSATTIRRSTRSTWGFVRMYSPASIIMCICACCQMWSVRPAGCWSDGAAVGCPGGTDSCSRGADSAAAPAIGCPWGAASVGAAASLDAVAVAPAPACSWVAVSADAAACDANLVLLGRFPLQARWCNNKPCGLLNNPLHLLQIGGASGGGASGGGAFAAHCVSGADAASCVPGAAAALGVSDAAAAPCVPVAAAAAPCVRQLLLLCSGVCGTARLVRSCSP